MARKALNVDVNKRKLTVQEIIMREGQQFLNAANFSGIYPSTQTQVGGALSNFNISRRAVNLQMVLTVYGAPVRMSTGSSTDSSDFYPSVVSTFWLCPGSPINIDEPGYITGPLMQRFTIGSGDDETAIKIGIVSRYKLITNDLNFDAEKTIGWQGDSISEPTVNADLTLDDMHHFRVRNWLIDNDPERKTYRLTICAVGGRTSLSYVKLLNAGSAGALPVSLSIDFYQFGMNDFDKISTSEYKANIRRWVEYRRRHYPDIVLVFLGTTPRMGDDAEAGVQIFRIAMAEVILDLKQEWEAMGLNPERLIGIDLARTFDRKERDNYAITDGGADITDAVHPGNAAANHGMATKITEGYDYTSDTDLGVNFPTEEHPEGLLPPGGLRQRNIFNLLK